MDGRRRKEHSIFLSSREEKAGTKCGKNADNNQECTDLDKISRAVFQFYSNLYSCSYLQVDAEAFFNKISEQIPNIDDCFKIICDAEIKMEEVEKALNCLKLDKSPGSDGLTSNFYKHFWDNLKDLLLNLLKEICNTLILPTTMKQGFITLIPKPGKNSKIIDDLRPITLLNNDYKLLTHIFANRLRVGIEDIVSDTQSGFIRGRSIHNNIRLILDLLDYNYLIEDKSLILFLDFF